MTTRTWTNATLRKELGEHGFFEVKESTIEVVPDGPVVGPNQWRSTWAREGAVVYLITREHESPTIESTSGIRLDIDAIGYRDPTVQQPEKGRGV